MIGRGIFPRLFFWGRRRLAGCGGDRVASSGFELPGEFR